MKEDTKNILWTLAIVAVFSGAVYAFSCSQMGRDIAGISSSMP